MPVSQSLSPVPFHGDTIFVVGNQGEPFAPMKPIVENLGLDWRAQQRKLSANRARWGMVMLTIPSISGQQQALCLPLRKITGFLATINPNKVRNELRAKIICYQNECDDALWNYWTKGKAERPASSTQPHQRDLPLDDSSPLSESEKDLLGTIKALDTTNRRLIDTLEETRANYIRLLESHVAILERQARPVAVSDSRRRKRRVDEVTVSEADQMRTLFANGLSRYQIAKIFNRGRTTVSKFVGGVDA